MQNDTAEKTFYNRIHPAELVPKVIQTIALCSYPMKEYPNDVELVGEAANTLEALLISCGNIIIDTDNNIFTPAIDRRGAVLSLMEEILSRTSHNLYDLLTKFLRKALQGDVDNLIPAHKICSFIRIMIEVDSFLRDSLSSAESVPWNMKESFASSSFANDVLVKLVEKEMTIIGNNQNTNANWQLTLHATILYSWDEARATSEYLYKRRSLLRIRTFLRVLSVCLPADATTSILSKLFANPALSSEASNDLLKEFACASFNQVGSYSKIIASCFLFSSSTNY